MTIHPGIGIGDIIYGISEEDLTAKLGKPDSFSETEYVEGTGDWHRVLSYDKLGLSFTFDLEDEYRLGVITVFGKGYSVFGRDVFGLSRADVELLLKESTGSPPTFEDFSIDELEPHWCLSHDDSGILYWFDSDKLTEMQCSYLFEDDDNTVIWPTNAEQ